MSAAIIPFPKREPMPQPDEDEDAEIVAMLEELTVIWRKVAKLRGGQHAIWRDVGRALREVAGDDVPA
jgi:hypothetical protein